MKQPGAAYIEGTRHASMVQGCLLAAALGVLVGGTAFADTGIGSIETIRADLLRDGERVLAPILLDPNGIGRLDVIRARADSGGEPAGEIVERRPLDLALERPPIDAPPPGIATRREPGRLAIRPDEWTIIRDQEETPAERPPLALSQAKHYLPDRILYLDPAHRFAPADASETVREARLFFALDRAPLRWLEQEGAYGADLIVGLDPPEDAPEEELGRPVSPPIQVVLTTEGASVPDEQRRLRLETLGEYAYVPLRADDHRVRPAVTARIPWDTFRLGARIDPRLARLDVRVQKPEPLGLGLETISFTVQRFAEDGRPLRTARRRSVQVRQLGAQGAGAQFPGTLRIEEGESMARGTLRAMGAGPFSWEVIEGDVTSDPASVVFVWPWLVILFTVAGGAGGTLARRVRVRAARRLALDFVIGVFVAMLVVAGVAVGVFYLEVDAPLATTGAGAFVLAALGGYGGGAVLDRLARSLGLPGPDAS